MRRILAAILLLFALFVFINAWFYRHMDTYLYQQAYEYTTLSLPHHAITFQSRNDKVEGLVLGKKINTKSERWILFCHSTENSMHTTQHTARYNAWRDLGLNIITFDYIGTGKTPGKPSELGCIESANAVLHYLINIELVDQKNIIIYGEGMGVPIAIQLAQKAQFSKLILEDGIASVEDHFRQSYPMLLFNVVLQERFSTERLKDLHQPKLFLYSDHNKDFSKEQTFDLYEMANMPKDISKLKGSHHTSISDNYETYLEALKTFIQ